ncbi:glycosyltransferase family A protein [Rhizobium sp. R693]|uniref:glycosyltransferase family 2 protein n=1 Tax=Rhizobium sp. R693 TaxID=1764276 RepID=UPI000B537865|nr:glycosyltransferase family A protein [Rhizobium sp. R693]OWV84508.1 hypothetical protein ATY79_11320 [Rhizobium sp. R693]
MYARNGPLVSVLTPVYNGDEFLRECIESVLSQTYQNWEYTIANNASTDGTLDIAEEYCRRDSRIRVISSDTWVPIVASHNRAFGLISKDSKYCKVVSADDWIYPECLEKMVGLAEPRPSVGIVGAYQLTGGGDRWFVRNVGLPYWQTVVSGRDICRAHLLGTVKVLGNPTSVLYRSDLVRKTDEFFPNPTQESDISACLKHLQCSDFGFVHQILAHERIHNQRATRVSLAKNAYVSADISDLQEYGEWYLTERERDARIGELLDRYYAYLSRNAFKFRGRTFWSYHAGRLRDLGYRFNGRKLCMGIAAEALDLVLNPKGTVETLSDRLRSYYMF